MENAASRPARPMTAKQLGSWLSRRNLLTGLPCFFLGTLLAGLGSLLAFSGVIGWPYGTGVRIAFWLCVASFALGLLSFAVFLRFLPRFRRPVAVHQSALDYAGLQDRWLERKLWLVLGCAALGLGLAGFLILAPHLSFSNVYPLAFLLLGVPAWFLLYRFLRRRVAALTNLIPVDGPEADPYDRRRELRRAWLLWGAYWLAALGAYVGLSLAFGNWKLYAFIPVLALLYFAARLALNNPFRPFASVRGRSILLRLLNVATAAALLIGSLNVMSFGGGYHKAFLRRLDYSVFRRDDLPAVEYDRDTGVYTLTAQREDFKILQLTDVHLGESLTTTDTDRKALQACYDLIRETQPDLIVVTGDIAYAIPAYTFSDNNLAAMGTFMDFMDRIGIPWAVTYGNHDNEPSSRYNDAKAFGGLFASYQTSGVSTALYSAYVQPDIYGRYNQYLRIENADGSLNRVIFLVDSNDYVKGPNAVREYDSVHPDQIQWYADTIDALTETEGRVVPSFVFMHIPFPAFQDAQDALSVGAPEAEYLFGQNQENVSCPKRDTGFFDAILEKGSTQAVFVGHDHLNNMAARYRGVDLVYSKSIDYVAYPGIADQIAQRGGTLITLTPGGGYEIEQVDYLKR